MTHCRVACAAGIVAALVVAGCASVGLSAPEVRVALAGTNQAPPNKSTAAGKASFWVHADRTLSGVVETSGIEGSSAHLHLGTAGLNGPVALELVRTSSAGPVAMEHLPISGASWTVPRSARFSDEHYRAFLAGEIYVQVHSARFPEGEIRGQLRP